jgi:hypothetical protein
MTDAVWPPEAREVVARAMFAATVSDADHINGFLPFDEQSGYLQTHYRTQADAALAALAPFLAAALAEARKAGLREAAAKVRVHAAAAKRCSDESDVIHRIRAEYLAKAFALNAAADDIEAAILALAEEEGA